MTLKPSLEPHVGPEERRTLQGDTQPDPIAGVDARVEEPSRLSATVPASPNSAIPTRSIRIVLVIAKPRGMTQKRYSATACQAELSVKRFAMYPRSVWLPPRLGSS